MMYIIYNKNNGKIDSVTSFDVACNSTQEKITHPVKIDPRYYEIDLTTGNVIEKDNKLNIEHNIEISKLRSKRDSLLSSSDWTQLPDVDLTPQQKTAWQQYRQELRDMDFYSPIWPTRPV